MLASLPTVSKRTFVGWPFILTLMGCWLSGRNSGTGNIESRDRKSTRLNSSHANISYAVFCLKKYLAQVQRLAPVNPVWVCLIQFRCVRPCCAPIHQKDMNCLEFSPPPAPALLFLNDWPPSHLNPLPRRKPPPD